MRFFGKLAPLALLFASCTFHSTSRDWNGVVGIDGNPIHYKSTTQIGWHLFGLWPMLGSARADEAIHQLTSNIALEHGYQVRIVDEDTSYLWWALLPFTLVLVPTVHSVGAEYQPVASLAARPPRD